MDNKTADDILKSGTGFMITLAETVRRYEKKGYSENLVAQYDHFECQSGAVHIDPDEFVVDEMVRFENTSDPDDQSIMYAISVPSKGLKGLYIDSYGTYHEGMSPEMLQRFKEHLH